MAPWGPISLVESTNQIGRFAIACLAAAAAATATLAAGCVAASAFLFKARLSSTRRVAKYDISEHPFQGEGDHNFILSNTL